MEKDPEQRCISEFTELAWKDLRKRRLAGKDITLHLEDVEFALELQEIKAEEGIADELDLRKARRIHQQNLRWTEIIDARTTAWEQYWLETTNRGVTLSLDLAKEGIKYLFILNSGTALGCLGLISNVSSKYQAAITWTMFSAVLGIFIVALGTAALINIYADVYGAARVYLLRKKGWLGIRTVTGFVNAQMKKKPVKLVDFAIYGSIAWFAFYTVIAFIILLNS